MSAPSELHETRVDLLLALAMLAGLTIPTQIDPLRIPDVARRSPDGRRLLLADAKATESPRCRETARRLAAYLRCCRPYVAEGIQVRLALCHGYERGQPTWCDLLRGVSSATYVCTDRPDRAMLTEDAWVSWVDLRGLSTRVSASVA